MIWSWEFSTRYAPQMVSNKETAAFGITLKFYYLLKDGAKTHVVILRSKGCKIIKIFDRNKEQVLWWYYIWVYISLLQFFNNFITEKFVPKLPPSS